MVHLFFPSLPSIRERLAQEYEHTGELLVELGSDQTSLHNPFGGGYYPVQLEFTKAQEVMENDPMRFKELVQERWERNDSVVNVEMTLRNEFHLSFLFLNCSLRRQVIAINKLASAGMHFWDYGNAFLLEAHRAGEEASSL